MICIGLRSFELSADERKHYVKIYAKKKEKALCNCAFGADVYFYMEPYFLRLSGKIYFFRLAFWQRGSFVGYNNSGGMRRF